MNFSDILDQWEKTPPKSHKKNTQNPEPKINPMDQWINRYGILDKDAQQEEYEQKRQRIQPLAARKLPIEAELDLHGLTQNEAEIALESFIDTCQRKKLKKALIIHGKGTHSENYGVLTTVVRNFIERDNRIGASGHPKAELGGSGATWLIIREL